MCRTQHARELRNIQEVNTALKKFKEKVEVDPQLYLLAWLLEKVWLLWAEHVGIALPKDLEGKREL